MKINGYVFMFLAVFLAITDTVYWVLSKDPTGTTCIALAGGLGLLIGFYLLFTATRMETRADDRPDADISEGAGVVGHFSPGSWWPIMIAASVLFVILGIIFGVWMLLLGVLFLLFTVTGLLFEHYAGYNARDWVS